MGADGGSDDAIAVFAASMRAVKERTGRGYRALAKQALVSSATLHRYCSGDVVPADFAVVLRFAKTLGASREELARLHQEWLAARLAQEGGQPPVSGPPQNVRPAQLPSAPRDFIGRAGQLARLEASRSGVVLISGTAGVGKTALALHWCHQVAQRFPDGQLFVNLRGYAPEPPLRPAEVLSWFLRALGVAPQRVPFDVDEAAALYRSVLSGKRMLVLLDNANQADQVRPLLPNSPGCLAVITSRKRLTSLLTIDGAHPLSLGLLPPDEAGELLSRRIGEDRVAAEPHAVRDVVQRCAGLPLALGIVAARAAARPEFPLGAQAQQLRQTRNTLDQFRDEDPVLDLRAVFSWSYQAISPEAARLFRQLAVVPGPDIGVAAVTSLSGAGSAEAARLLAELASAHLVVEHTPARYAFHDLLRAYAAELAESCDSQAQRQAAFARLFDHYLHTAQAAALHLFPRREPVTDVPPPPGVTPERFADCDEVLAWFADEHRVLLAVVAGAADAQFADAWRLSVAVAAFLDRRGLWQDWAATQRTVLPLTQRLSDRAGQARVQRSLGRAELRLGRPDSADVHLRRAFDLFEQLGDRVMQAHTHLDLARSAELQGMWTQALEHAGKALHLHRMTGHLSGQANGLNAVGWFLSLLGRQREAIVHCEQSLAIYRQLGDAHSEAWVWDTLGHAHHQLGDYPRAIRCYRHAVDGHRAHGDRYQEAASINRLGDTHHAAAEPQAARQAWLHALEVFGELGHSDGNDVRIKLDDLVPHGCGRRSAAMRAD